jgi:hypothetical protein
MADRFTRLVRQRRHKWVLLALVDDDWIELTGNEIYSFAAFRARTLEQQGIHLPEVRKADWEALVKRRVEEAAREWVALPPSRPVRRHAV